MLISIEALVESFQNNNEEYIRIIKSVQEKVLGVLSNAKVLLSSALLSITESIRNDPERHRSLFYNMSPSITDCYSNGSQDYTYSYAYRQIQQSQQYPSSNYNTEANIAMIVEEAEKLYSKVVKDCINKAITDRTFSKSSLPSLPLISDSEEEQQ